MHFEFYWYYAGVYSVLSWDSKDVLSVGYKKTLTSLLWWYLQYPQYLTLSASDPCSSHNNPANWALWQKKSVKKIKEMWKKEKGKHLCFLAQQVLLYQQGKKQYVLFTDKKNQKWHEKNPGFPATLLHDIHLTWQLTTFTLTCENS